MKWHTTVRGDAGIDENLNMLEAEEDAAIDDADAHVALIEFPGDGTMFDIIIFICLFPLRFIMHWTLPDVRHLDSHGDSTTGICTAFFATFMCLVWLIIGSYAMVASLEGLAELMDIPDSVVGFTVSAAGT